MEGDLKMKTASSSSSSSFDRYRGRPRSDGWKAAELRADEWVVGHDSTARTERTYCPPLYTPPQSQKRRNTRRPSPGPGTPHACMHCVRRA